MDLSDIDRISQEQRIQTLDSVECFSPGVLFECQVDFQCFTALQPHFELARIVGDSRVTADAEARYPSARYGFAELIDGTAANMNPLAVG